MVLENIIQIIFESLLSFVLEHFVWDLVFQYIKSCCVTQLTLRVLDDLLDKIDEATDSKTSCLEWLRDAARTNLDGETEDATETNEG